MYSGLTNLDMNPPNKTVMRVTSPNAVMEAKNTVIIEPDFADRDKLASCVLSPNSAKKIVTKAAKNIFQSMAFSFQIAFIAYFSINYTLC